MRRDDIRADDEKSRGLWRWRVLWMLAAVVPLAGCPGKKQPKSVVASCTHVEQYHSNLGTVNVPLYALGKVLVLSSAGDDQRAYGGPTLKVEDADKNSGAAADKMTVDVDAKFDLAFDADVPAAVKAHAETSLGRTVSAELTNVSRTDLSDAVGFANRNEELKTLLKNSAGDSTKRFVIVSSVKGADSLDLKLASSVDGKVTANVLKFGDVDLKVTYKCDSMLKLTGKQTGVFYSVTPLRFSEETGAVVLDDRPVNVWKFDHSNAFSAASQ